MMTRICRWMICAGFVALAGAVLVACSSAGNTRGAVSRLGLTPQVEIARAHDWQLAARSRIYLAYPETIASSVDEFPRTQAHLRRLLHTGLSPRFQIVVDASSQRPLEESFAAARSAGCDVFLRPIITEARFRQDGDVTPPLFEASARVIPEPDYQHLAVSVQVYETHSRRLLDTVSVTAKRPWPASERAENSLAPAAVEALLDSLSR